MVGIANCIELTNNQLENMSLDEINKYISKIEAEYTPTMENDIFLMLAYWVKDFVYESMTYIKKVKSYVIAECGNDTIEDVFAFLKEYKPDGHGNYYEIDWDKLIDGGSRGGGGNKNDDSFCCLDCCDELCDGCWHDFAIKKKMTKVEADRFIHTLHIIKALLGIGCGIAIIIYLSNVGLSGFARGVLHCCEPCITCGNTCCDACGNFLCG